LGRIRSKPAPAGPLVKLALKRPRGMKMTIYETLKSKLGRQPLNSELKAEVKRIISEAYLELAEKSRLPHQRRR
jgi:hypothetical protein